MVLLMYSYSTAVLLLLCGVIINADAFTSRSQNIRVSSSLHIKGCAAKPLEKKKVAVFGTGGYMGAITYGFLQRASSLYGTGISNIRGSPRAIGATSGSLEALNKELGSKFKAAFCSEDLVRLVDTSDVDHIKDRLQDFDAAILGTSYQLEQRKVTLNTYESSPNEKVYEIYLDERYGAWNQEVAPSDDADIHTYLFRNSVQACKAAGLSHLVVFETPRTVQPSEFVNILEEEGMKYTYIRTNSPLSKDLTFTFEKGISNKLDVRIVQSIDDIDKQETEKPISREDLSALIVQSLMSLDWEESRIIEVRASDVNITSGYGTKEKRKQKYDSYWCPNSDVLAEALSTL